MDLRDPKRDETYQSTRDGTAAQQQEWPGTTKEMDPRPDHGEESYRGTGKLEGKVALVTGGDSGIGRAVAIAFAKEGADIAIAYFDEHEDAKETARHVERAGRRAYTVACDLQQPAECRRIVEETVERLGGLDILVNNAAYQCETDFLDLGEEEVERTFRTNIMANIYCTQAAIRRMPKGGVVLNTGSVQGFEGSPGLVAYAATKAGISNFTRTLAQPLAERGIRINCVAPGPVWTPLIPATLSESHVEGFGTQTVPYHRPAQPIEIATSFVFLASEDGRYYTGETLAPTGGTTSR